MGSTNMILFNRVGVLNNFSRLLSTSLNKNPSLVKCNLIPLTKRCLQTTTQRFSNGNTKQFRSRSFALYCFSAGIFMVGASYAGVPLYRIFCQKTGYGGETKRDLNSAKLEGLTPVKDRIITVKFNADINANMQWNFRPQQSEIKLVAGETALAFYRAKNPSDRPIIGISTYNVVPFEAGPYFNKIQCFCFEEQRLSPHEEVDMPVFFYIDPEFCDDPALENVKQIALSYTFFESKKGIELPRPSYATSHNQ